MQRQNVTGQVVMYEPPVYRTFMSSTWLTNVQYSLVQLLGLVNGSTWPGPAAIAGSPTSRPKALSV